MEERENNTTQFNSSLRRLISLNNLLDECNEYSRLSYVNGKNVEYLKLWRHTLLAVYREISPKLTIQEKKYIIKLLNLSKKIGRVIYSVNTEEGITQELDPNKFNKHWNLYNKVDEKLRILADIHGMLITDKIDSDNIDMI